MNDFQAVKVLRWRLRVLAPRADLRNAINVCGGVQKYHAGQAWQCAVITNEVDAVLSLVMSCDERLIIRHRIGEPKYGVEIQPGVLCRS